MALGVYKNIGVYDSINRKKMPGDIPNFIYRETGRYNFFDDLYTLRKELREFNSTTEDDSNKEQEEYYKRLFSCLVYFFLGDTEDCLTNLNWLQKNTQDPIIKRLLVSLKYKILPLQKILILISSEGKEEVNYSSISRKYKDVDLLFIYNFIEKNFVESLHKYKQIFLIGHGDEEETKIGGKEVTVPWLCGLLDENPNKKIGLLGVLSCGEAFDNSEIYTRVDYFITDTITSNLQFSEMFLFSFIQNYLLFPDVPNSFTMGKIATSLRAVANPGFVLYEGGVLTTE